MASTAELIAAVQKNGNGNGNGNGKKKTKKKAKKKAAKKKATKKTARRRSGGGLRELENAIGVVESARRQLERAGVMTHPKARRR